jgi:16S rRNA (cytidine1402-2'-O)-methyltransferase
VKELQRGKSVALVSSAGTPGISDPAYLLVEQCIEQNITYTCLPGPTAFVPAIVGSGLPADRFYFEGFLPRKKGRHTRLQTLAKRSATLVFYVPPHRLLKTLKEFMEYFTPERPAAFANELSRVQ